MEHFVLGIVVTIVIVIGTYATKAPVDALLNELNTNLDKNDQKTLSKLIKFKAHRIAPLAFILLTLLVGYWCGVIMQ